jgi:hypothetical protein
MAKRAKKGQKGQGAISRCSIKSCVGGIVFCRWDDVLLNGKDLDTQKWSIWKGKNEK